MQDFVHQLYGPPKKTVLVIIQVLILHIVYFRGRADAALGFGLGVWGEGFDYILYILETLYINPQP